MGHAEIIPVMDIMKGQVVHGISGKRNEYRPIESRIVKGCDPVEVANAFRTTFDVDVIYIADLDAIRGQGDNFDQIAEVVNATGMKVLLDGGISTESDVEEILNTGAHRAILATETISSMDELGRILQSQRKSIVGSLDLMNGKTMSACERFRGKEPVEMAQTLEESGIQDLIVLELSLVGSGKGPVHESLVQICENSSMRIIAGGGVRNRRDLRDLFNIGARAALVATALHQMTIEP